MDFVLERFLEKILFSVLEERFPEVESLTEHLKNITRKPCLQSRMGKLYLPCCKPDMKRKGVSHCADFSFSVQFYGMIFFSKRPRRLTQIFFPIGRDSTPVNSPGIAFVVLSGALPADCVRSRYIFLGKLSISFLNNLENFKTAGRLSGILPEDSTNKKAFETSLSFSCSNLYLQMRPLIFTFILQRSKWVAQLVILIDFNELFLDFSGREAF